MALDVHVVSHTHWDREWYHPFERFRQLLVGVVDELLDDPPSEGGSFVLDGQAILIEDYLAIRPERVQRLGELLRSGRFEAGPWYVLSDELIPSGEALVRNLLAGRRVLASVGAAAPHVLYCPDSFGHPAILPELAVGFDCGVIVTWRGYGGARWPAGDTAWWRGPSGARALLYHLPRDGYELGASLPLEPEGAAHRWSRIWRELSPRSTVGVALLLNGADHHAPQRGRERAIAMLGAAAGDVVVHKSSIEAFQASLTERASAHRLPTVSGELRDSYGYTWTLQGTFATRAAQKRANALAERALLRSAEPWSALAWFSGARSRRALVEAAWRTLLHAHPHDTLCGCSIDAVAASADGRFAATQVEAAGVRDDSIRDLLGYDADTARANRDAWRPAVIVRNEIARPRGGVVVVDVVEFLADEPVGPGSGSVVARLPDGNGAVYVGSCKAQVLERRLGRDRIEAPRSYPDNDLVMITRVAALAEAVPAYGLVAIPIAAGRRARTQRAKYPVRAKRRALGNGLISIEVREGGEVAFTGSTGLETDSMLVIEDLVDRGDLYTPSVRGVAAVAKFLRATIVHRGPLVGELLTRWRLVGADVGARADAMTTLDVSFVIHANSSMLRVLVHGTNRSTDHRLRIGFRTGIADAPVWADAAFGPVLRAPVVLSVEEKKVEHAPGTAPLHRYVSLFSERAGATLFSDGLAEYEATPDGTVFVTLLRAVGELSRSDLPERPGHAGWPTSTPAAQSLGPFNAELGFLPHGPRNDAMVQEVERLADDVLLPLAGFTLRSMLAIPAPIMGVWLDGDGLVLSAIKESEDGKWLVLRCVNLADDSRAGVWTLGRPLAEAALARLDETWLDSLAVHGARVEFRAEARQIVTILVR